MSLFFAWRKSWRLKVQEKIKKKKKQASRSLYANCNVHASRSRRHYRLPIKSTISCTRHVHCDFIETVFGAFEMYVRHMFTVGRTREMANCKNNFTLKLPTTSAKIEAASQGRQAACWKLFYFVKHFRNLKKKKHATLLELSPNKKKKTLQRKRIEQFITKKLCNFQGIVDFRGH